MSSGKYLDHKNKYMELKNQSGGVFDKKVLILCHNKLVTGTFDPLVLNNHWYGLDGIQLFTKLFAEYKLSGTPEFETVDILPGGTYKEDAFSDDFINKHLGDYDMVLVPDCAGPWWELQSVDEEKKNDSYLTMINLCIKLTKMVKQGGIIHFGKIIYNRPCTINKRDFESLVAALKFYLDENGLVSKIVSPPGLGECIVAVKN